MFDPISIAVGLALALGIYFLYLCATKGLPAAWAWLKAKWTAGAAELATLKADLGARVTALEADVAKLKKPAAAPAPAAPAAAPAAAANPAAAAPQ